MKRLASALSHRFLPCRSPEPPGARPRAGNLLPALAVLLLLGAPARAGEGGYFVAYNSKIHKGEREFMLMSDYTRPSQANREEGQNEYFSQMLELEWHVTDRFASELMLEGHQEPGGEREFTGFRWENRLRLFRDEVPFNPMLYMEYEHLSHRTRFKMETSGWVHAPYEEEEEIGPPKDERILETRLVLSQNFGATNVAFNWINETDLRTGRTDFGYAAGVMYAFGGGSDHSAHSGGAGRHSRGRKGLFSGFRLAGLGAELFGGLGDDHRLDLRPDRQQHYLGPVALFHFGDEWMFHISPTVGLSKGSDRLLVRFALGFEF